MATAGQPEVEEQEPQSSLLSVNWNNAPHFVKLRASFCVNDRCRAEIGWDNDISQPGAGNSRPWGALLFQLDDKKGGPSMEVNNDFVALNKSFELKMKKITVGVDAQVGLTTSGKPHISIGISNLPIVLAAAAVMLYLQKPIHVSKKETGGLSLDLPICGSTGPSFSLQERAQLDFTLRRKGRGVEVDFHELSGVLRLREDKPKSSCKACNAKEKALAKA